MSYSELLQTMQAEMRKLTSEASELRDTAAAERRDMTEAESARFEAKLGECRDLSERISLMEQRVAKDQELNQYSRNLDKVLATGAASAGEYTDPFESRALEFFMGRGGHALDVPLTGLRVQRNAQGRAEVRSLTDGMAGAPVPTQFRSVLYQKLLDNSQIRSVATVLTSNAGMGPLILPIATPPADGTIVAEAALLNEVDPTFAQGTLSAYKYGELIQISSELEEDTGIDLLGYIANIMGQTLARGSGSDFISGSGTNKPQGVLVGAGTTHQVVGGTPAAAGATYNDLVALFESVKPVYQVNAGFFMSQTAKKAMISLVNSQGTPLFMQSLQATPGDSLFGKPVAVDPFMPAVAVGGTSIAFGDFTAYTIRDSALRFERSVDYAFGNDLVTYRALLRTDARLLNTDALATYKGGTA